MKDFIMRLKLPTPIFFKKIRAWIIWIGGTMTVLSTISTAINPNSTLSIIASTVGIVFTTIGTITTSLPVDWEQVKNNQ